MVGTWEPDATATSAAYSVPYGHFPSPDPWTTRTSRPLFSPASAASTSLLSGGKTITSRFYPMASSMVIVGATTIPVFAGTPTLTTQRPTSTTDVGFNVMATATIGMPPASRITLNIDPVFSGDSDRSSVQLSLFLCFAFWLNLI